MVAANVESGAERRRMPGRMRGRLSLPKLEAGQRRSMRFSPPVEAAFLASRHSTICLNISYVSMLALCVIAIDFSYFALRWSEHIYILRVRCVELGAELALALLCAVLPRAAFVQRRVSFVAMEALACVCIVWFGLQTVLVQPVVLREIFGMPAEALQALVDTKQHVVLVSLGLDAVLTISHLALPVRWFIMLWVDLLFVVVYSVYAYMAFSALSEEISFEDFQVILFFAALAAGASFGSLSAESRDRRLFTQFADERTRRVQAEFKADSQVQDTGKGTGTPSKTSNWSSDAASLFRDAAEQNEGSLARLVDLGIREQWLIAEHELNVFQDNLLGKGAHGTVVAGTFCSSPVAIKCYRRGGSSTVFDELRIMRRLRHPNIVLFYGACVDTSSSDLKLVLEFVPGPILNTFIAQVKAWRSESPKRKEQLAVMMGVCQALIYLHSRKPCIVHSDLKPMNIMVEWRNSVPIPKLLDFGLSRRVRCGSTPAGGTRRYMAPEAVSNPEKRISPAVDVYSLGLVHFCVASGRIPFEGLEATMVSRLILDEQRAPDLDWQPSTALLRMLQPLIQQCAALAPASRPTVQQVYDELHAMSSSACSSTSSDAALPIIEEALGQRNHGNLGGDTYSI